MKNHVAKLRRLCACDDAVRFAEQYPNMTAGWRACERGDWMLWLLGRTSKLGSARHRRIVRVACACVRRALPYVAKGELRPLAAIEAAEAWARRDSGVTLGDVRAAADTAGTAAAAAYTAAGAAYTAGAAAYTAAGAAGTAAAAAYTAAGAAGAAAYTVTRSNELHIMAGLVRAEFPYPPRVPKEGV